MNPVTIKAKINPNEAIITPASILEPDSPIKEAVDQMLNTLPHLSSGVTF